MAEIVIDSSSDDEGAMNWGSLPPNVLERIYGFLSRGDRFRMSLVCRRWSKEYSSPSLWRTIEFRVRRQRCQSDFYPEVRCAWKYGRFFRHVKITFEPLDDAYKKAVSAQLVMFLQAVTSESRLISLSFVYLALFVALDFRHPHYEEVLGNVISLVERQTCLKTIEFHGDCFAMWDTMEIVETAFGRENWSLRNLTLKCFSEYFILDCQEDEEVVNADIIPYLISLDKLEMDYSQFFEEVIFELLRSTQGACTSVGNHAIGTLKKLILHCDGKFGQYSYGRYLGISALAWKHIRNVCPELVTELYFSNWCNSFASGIEFYIVRDMPLKALHFQLIPDPVAKLSFLLRHLVTSGINENLEEFSIDWPQPSPQLGCDLREYINVFPELRRLELHVSHPADDLHVIFNTWMLDRPKSLEMVHITVTHIPFHADRFPIYATLRNHYVPKLQVLGLHLTLTVEDG